MSQPGPAADASTSRGPFAFLTGMPVFAASVFLGAFLLFQVQPLLARYILPWFGGGPSVWTICMLFFQTLLLCGYGYAHLLATRVPPGQQGKVHAGLLALSLLLLPIAPDADIWSESGVTDPTLQILLLLLVTVGLPYVLLSATSPLMHRWMEWRHPGRSAYRLYAVSNTGSLLALLSYPVLVEPWFSLRSQAESWSWAYGAFFLVCAACGLQVSGGATSVDAEDDEERPGAARILYWLLLSACGSALLLSTTNQMSQEVAVVPFLWIVPLTLYLLSFILCFESDAWYRRSLYGFALAVTVPVSCIADAAGTRMPLGWQMLIFAATLFAACMTCHGELALSRPHGRHATKFYLIVAAGGAIGGAFVSLAAPRLFPDYWEFQFLLGASAVIALYVWIGPLGWRPRLGTLSAACAPPPFLAVALATALSMVGLQLSVVRGDRSRNFYGVLRISDEQDAHGRYRQMTHGATVHGTEYLEGPLKGLPTTYYAVNSGVGTAIERHPNRLAGKPMHIGVVGLGAGTLGAYGRPGDSIRFYEINPDVIEAAETEFSYLSGSRAQTAVTLGDARVRLEDELAHGEPGDFDVLAVDGFSSDSVPAHLLTAEAGEVYARHLAEDGILAFHTTNQFLDLAPVIRGMAQRLGMSVVRITTGNDDSQGVNETSWMLLTRDQSFLSDPVVQAKADTVHDDRSLAWTDDFSGLWRILR